MLLEAVSCLASFAVSDSWESCNPVVYSRSPGMQQTYWTQLNSKNLILLNNVSIWLLSKEINKKPLQSCEGGSIFLTYRITWLYIVRLFYMSKRCYHPHSSAKAFYLSLCWEVKCWHYLGESSFWNWAEFNKFAASLGFLNRQLGYRILKSLIQRRKRGN